MALRCDVLNFALRHHIKLWPMLYLQLPHWIVVKCIPESSPENCRWVSEAHFTNDVSTASHSIEWNILLSQAHWDRVITARDNTWRVTVLLWYVQIFGNSLLLKTRTQPKNTRCDVLNFALRHHIKPWPVLYLQLPHWIVVKCYPESSPENCRWVSETHFTNDVSTASHISNEIFSYLKQIGIEWSQPGITHGV